MSERRYPITPRPATDRRFDFGLLADVGQVLVDHGLPPVTAGADLVERSSGGSESLVESRQRPP